MNSLIHIRNETNELRLLFEVCQALEGSTDLARRLEAVLGLMARHTGMMCGAIFLTEGRNNLVRCEAAHGPPTANTAPSSHPLCETAARMALESGAPTVVPLAGPPPFALHKAALRGQYKEDIAFICVPVGMDGQHFGALVVDRLFADSVSLEEDVRLLQVLASLIVQALKARVEFDELHSAVVEENRRLQALLHERFHPGGIVGNSAALRAVFNELTQVANSNATVLIRGESGTGKELVAGTIHANSPRSGRPFVRVNCAALPEGLVESELFGHERGAFTGATGMRKGRFELAHGGTLFLDEVGDLTPLTQAKLLRALQEKEFERVGGTETRRVDVRLIAATNRDLEQMVAQGSFRRDLYYRLSVFPIMLPPLRERRDDIMLLANHFAEQYAEENHRHILRISSGATMLLTSYAWPGNIRELENVMERAVLLCGTTGVIEALHLPPALQDPDHIPEQGLEESGSLDAALAALERRLIVETLQEERGNMAKAAARLGITERIMGLRMKKYGLQFRAFRSGS